MGTCRRYPLTAVKLLTKEEQDADRSNANFPRLRGFGWCGEWKSVVTDDVIAQTAAWAQSDNKRIVDDIRTMVVASRIISPRLKEDIEKLLDQIK